MELIRSSYNEGIKYENLIEDNLYSFGYLEDIKELTTSLYDYLRTIITGNYVVLDRNDFTDKFTNINYTLRKIDLVCATIFKYSYLIPYGKELENCKYDVEKKIITKFIGESPVVYEIMPELTGDNYFSNINISILNVGIKKQFEIPTEEYSNFDDIDDIIIFIKNDKVGIDRYFSVAKGQAKANIISNEANGAIYVSLEISQIFVGDCYKNENSVIDVYEETIFGSNLLYDVNILFVHTTGEYEVDGKLTNYVVLNSLELPELLLVQHKNDFEYCLMNEFDDCLSDEFGNLLMYQEGE